MREKRIVKICPICGSPKIRKISRFSGWLTPEIWVCEECGYMGPVYAEREVKVEKNGKVAFLGSD